MKIGIIVLAAGGSSRMNGEPKQLLEFEGSTLLRRAVQTAMETECGPVLVVLGANVDNLLPEVQDLPVIKEVNHDWIRGMGSSIKIALSKLLTEEPDIDAVILMLADQPLITASHLQCLSESYSGSKALIIASEYENTIGVPALFSRQMFKHLGQIPDDKGAKFLLLASEKVEKVSIPEASVDIDSRQDYDRLKSFVATPIS